MGRCRGRIGCAALFKRFLLFRSREVASRRSTSITPAAYGTCVKNLLGRSSLWVARLWHFDIRA